MATSIPASSAASRMAAWTMSTSWAGCEARGREETRGRKERKAVVKMEAASAGVLRELRLPRSWQRWAENWEEEMIGQRVKMRREVWATKVAEMEEANGDPAGREVREDCAAL